MAQNTIKTLQARIRKLECCSFVTEVYVENVTTYTIDHGKGRRVLYTITDSSNSSATVGSVIDDGNSITFNFGVTFSGWITYI